MAIREEKLIELIKSLKKNGYKVSRDGGATVDGMATGLMTIRYKDASNRYGLKHEIDVFVVENLEAVLTEKFNI
jgi:hypothetical protein